jgi:hypothetical protein
MCVSLSVKKSVETNLEQQSMPDFIVRVIAGTICLPTSMLDWRRESELKWAEVALSHFFSSRSALSYLVCSSLSRQTCSKPFPDWSFSWHIQLPWASINLSDGEPSTLLEKDFRWHALSASSPRPIFHDTLRAKTAVVGLCVNQPATCMVSLATGKGLLSPADVE